MEYVPGVIFDPKTLQSSLFLSASLLVKKGKKKSVLNPYVLIFALWAAFRVDVTLSKSLPFHQLGAFLKSTHFRFLDFAFQLKADIAWSAHMPFTIFMV
jgi:hypothetical protein